MPEMTDVNLKHKLAKTMKSLLPMELTVLIVDQVQDLMWLQRKSVFQSVPKGCLLVQVGYVLILTHVDQTRLETQVGFVEITLLQLAV